MYKKQNLMGFNLLNEELNSGEFFLKVSEKYPNSEYVLGHLNTFLKNSGCQNVYFDKLKLATGVSLVDRAVLDTSVLYRDFTDFLYVFFHEIAHQYQYRKYGIDKIYGAYTGEVDLQEAAEFMKYLENVADEFAVRKIKETKNLFGDKIKIRSNVIKQYSKYKSDDFIPLINNLKESIKKHNITNKEEISAIIYNYVKNKL